MSIRPKYKPTKLQPDVTRGTSKLNLSWRRPLSYRNQSIDLQSKSMNWFLYDNGFGHERAKSVYKCIGSGLCLKFYGITENVT